MPFFSPVSAGGIGKATYTATTGSPTIDTSSRSGKTIINFTGSGSITVAVGGCEQGLAWVSASIGWVMVRSRASECDC